MLCVLVGFYSCCILKYDFIVYMIHSIISHGIYFKYLICESLLSIAYSLFYICVYIYICMCVNERCTLFSLVMRVVQVMKAC